MLQVDQPDRGYLLELMLTKLRYSIYGTSANQSSNGEGLQVRLLVLQSCSGMICKGLWPLGWEITANACCSSC